MDAGFYDAYRYSGGANWKQTASFPPMLYPTHSTSMILSVTGARMTEVACFGYVDCEDDGVFAAEVSQWGNVFSNQSALFRTSDGGMARINEFRRVGYHASPEVRMSLFGTLGSFETQTNPHSQRRPPDNLSVWQHKPSGALVDVTDRLTCGPSAEEGNAASHVARRCAPDSFPALPPSTMWRGCRSHFKGWPMGMKARISSWCLTSSRPSSGRSCRPTTSGLRRAAVCLASLPMSRPGAAASC